MKWLDTFPTHNATVATGLFIFALTGIVIAVRLAIGLIMPEGYTPWITAVVAVAGVTTIGGIGKRLTDSAYVTAKAKGPPQINVGGPTTVTTETQIPPQ